MTGYSDGSSPQSLFAKMPNRASNTLSFNLLYITIGLLEEEEEQETQGGGGGKEEKSNNNRNQFSQ
jgi:hypothetical protein